MCEYIRVHIILTSLRVKPGSVKKGDLRVRAGQSH